MDKQRNVDTVQAYLQAQKNSDTARLQELLSPQVEWYGGLIGSVVGAGNVEKLLNQITASFDFERSEVRDFIAQRDKVVVLGSERLKVKATGQAIENEFAMVFTVKDGVITKCATYEDTAAVSSLLGRTIFERPA